MPATIAMRKWATSTFRSPRELHSLGGLTRRADPTPRSKCEKHVSTLLVFSVLFVL